MDFRERYKRVGFGREDVEINRVLRSQRRDEVRREMRSEHFNLRRCMGNNSDDSLERQEHDKKNATPMDSEEEARKKVAADLEAAVQKRLLQLEKWREERNRRRIQEKKRAKPVFKVGVVHHRVYSPPLIKIPIPLPVPKLCKSKEAQSELVPKRVTRATEKRLAIKTVTNQQKRENLRSKKPKKIELQTIPLIPKDHQFKAPLGVIPIPMFGRQALEDTNENMELDLSSINISSTNSEFLKSLSINSTEHIFSSTTHSSVIPKFTNRRSNANKFNADLCDMSTNKSFNDSLNNSSIETVSLKISSDDQEILSHEENAYIDYKTNFSFIKNTSIENKMPTSNILIPDTFSVIKPIAHSLINQEIIENKNYVDSNLSIKNKALSKISNRNITKKTISSDNLTKSFGFLSKNKIMNTQKSLNSNYSDTNYQLNSSFLKEKKTKSLANGQRPNTISINETVNFTNVTKENNFLLKNKTISDNDSDPNKIASMMDFTILEQNKVKLPRRSTRTSFNVNPSISNSTKESSYSLENREMPTDREDVNFNCINLMDSSFMSQNETKTFEIKKLTKIANKIQRHISETQDDSLIKFSPRRSLRQVEKSTKQRISSTVTTSKKNFSCVESFNISNISEPIRQKTPEKEENNSQNFSLNLSLVKDSTPEKSLAFFSPYIVTSRGKSSIRKEVQRRRLSQPSPKEIPTKDTIMQSLNISVEEEERTAQYYKYILRQEIDRLNERCDIWNVIKEDDITPDEIRYNIQAAVGQTQLLINKKFERFRSLVLDCETGKGEMLVTCKDLQGFWDMMYMEIKDCDNRFNKLEELKQKNWIDDETEEEKNVEQLKKEKLVGVKKPVDRKKTISTKPSSLRAHIMAARKKKIGSKEIDVDIELTEPIIENEKTSLQKNEEPKNLSNKITVKTARRSSTPKSSSKLQPILKKLSQSQKCTSPLIVMKLSQMCKTPEVHLDDSIIYINSSRTPAKSILKTSKDDLISFTGKSTNKVFFKEQPVDLQEIKSHNKNKIDNNKEPIERKLDFESDSFNSSRNEEQSDNIIHLASPGKSNIEQNAASEFLANPKIVINEKSLTSPIFPLFTTVNTPTTYLTIPKTIVKHGSPIISVFPMTLMDSKVEDSNKKPTKTKKQISFKEDINENYSRTLRSRKFSVPLTPRLHLKNSMKKVDEDLSMEVDNSTEEYKDDSPFPISQKSQLKELYLNGDGIIYQRIVKGEKDIPITPKLKLNNLETYKNIKFNKTSAINLINITPTTSKLKLINYHTPTIDINNPVTPVLEVANENKKSSSTPRVRRQNSKKSLTDTQFREDNANTCVEEITTIKLNRTTKTLNIAKSNTDEIETMESAKKKLRKKSTPVNIKSNLKTNSKQFLTPNSKKRNSKKLQENIEPTLQETNQNANENVKMLRTSNLKRNTLKKFTRNFERNQQQNDVNETISEELIPNRRKSLRGN